MEKAKRRLGDSPIDDKGGHAAAPTWTVGKERSHDTVPAWRRRYNKTFIGECTVAQLVAKRLVPM